MSSHPCEQLTFLESNKGNPGMNGRRAAQKTCISHVAPAAAAITTEHHIVAIVIANGTEAAH